MDAALAAALKAAGVAAAADGTDSWWRSCATVALEHLAESGLEFDAYDLSLLGVPEPDRPCRWGALFYGARARGVVELVGYAPSRRPTVHGAIVRRWRGART